MFKWYWLYKKEHNQKNVEENLYACSYVLLFPGIVPVRKWASFLFCFLWQCPLENVIKPLVLHFQFIFPNSTNLENLTTYYMDILINDYFQ